MLKLYDDRNNFIKNIQAKDIKVTAELETGAQTLQFLMPYDTPLKEQERIEFGDYRYVIKEITMENNRFYEVYCNADFGSLLTKHIDNLVGFNMTLREAAAAILEETDWSFVADGIAGSYTLNIHNMIAKTAINKLCEIYQVYAKYDTKQKKIEFVDKDAGEYKGTFTFDATNISICKVESDSHDIITRLIPLGKDMQTIANVNDNCLWVEDYSYTTETLTAYWIEQNISNPIDLKTIAEEKIAELAKPRVTYRVAMRGLPQDVKVGDKVRVIDVVKGVDVVRKVIKTENMPFHPEESWVMLGNLAPSFDILYKDFNSAQNEVNKDTLRSLTELHKLSS